MMAKEATANVLINDLPLESDWRLFDDESRPTDIPLGAM